MRHSLPLLCLLFTLSCMQQESKSQTAPPDNAGKPQTATAIPAADPYFKETSDITTAYGPHSITRNILQDRSGNFWFATWEGIIRYDGKTFTNVTNQAGLNRFHVFSLVEDRAGNLWFGTIGTGVYRYDGHSFTLFTTQQGLAGNSVSCMLADQAGNIWMGTNQGVSRYDGHTFSTFSTNEGLPDNDVNALAQDQAGNIWIGTFGGICRYDGKRLTPFNNAGKPFVNVRSLVAGKAGNIWIGGADGLYSYDGKALTNFSPDFIGYILEDRSGNIWVSAGIPQTGGMAVYRYGKNAPGISAAPGKPEGISVGNFTEILRKVYQGDQQVFGILEDRGGNLWFGTMKGVLRYDGKSITGFAK